MPPSKTALVLANRGDPIFGALARLALKGVRAIRTVIQGRTAATRAIATIGRGTGPAGVAVRAAATIARSKTARVVLGGAAFGGAAEVGTRIVAGIQRPAAGVQGEFITGEGGCPTGKVVNVAAHQRIIPLDRFGRPRRRIDVLNTKALSRATRRLGGFQKRARRVEKQLARIAPRSRSRRRSKGVC